MIKIKVGYGVVVVLFAIVGFSIFKIVQTSNEQDKRNKAIKQELEKYKATTFIEAQHMAGLPLSEGALCKIFMCEDKIVMKSVDTNSVYNLYMNKILHANIKSEQEIHTNYVSSVGGAVGGAVLFGPLGAMIGGRTKKKTDKIDHRYLIFTYNNEKENKVDYVSFDVTGSLKAQAIVNYCNIKCNRNIVEDL